MNYPSFLARPITGSGRGKDLGTPTINLHMDDVPADLPEGIYGCYVRLTDEWLAAAMHYGPRPVFNDTDSCEIYVLDRSIDQTPEHVEVALIGFVREVLDFPSPADLTKRIEQDVKEIRAMLSQHEPPTS